MALTGRECKIPKEMKKSKRYSWRSKAATNFPVVKAGDCFGRDPRNDTGYAFDDIWYVVIMSTFALLRVNSAKQSFSRKQSVPPDKR
ncbi:MAG: hypothetical protein AYP45_09540 [Candidatus Brocadia carolinensis]|uniref:Uncharacterized protein n=1 Tax=Candidatus Brocadia carolinensis TaxID=1004156 RepID=A0A1V4AT92_9BACT|nr:MAG: hypothetical protein AYP45_09540 [Candidatus Brocadia caroliniensis]